jgi:2-succinyl-5-enolpyruvyl-6-hydroxy-3-cyclohexene-1-carboxylate synthase
LTADDECRHSGDAQRVRSRQLLADFADAFFGFEECSGGVGVEADIGRERDEVVVHADLSPLDEVGAEQAFLEGPLHLAALGRQCPPQQPVCVERVGALGQVHAVFEAVLGGDCGEVGKDLPSPFVATEFLRVRVDHGSSRTTGRSLIELVRAPLDVEPVAHLRVEPFECFFEPPLADVTPWADHIGEDLDHDRLGLRRDSVHEWHDRRVTAASDTQATFCATLVDEWIRSGVRHAVIAPGSRSTPMALALAARKELTLSVFHDERSASFAALGIGVATHQPAVLLCTSGTAATHFAGAVAEADLSCVPMIVCTADRPPELHHVGAAQTIEQHHLYGSAPRWAFDPGVADQAAGHTWRSVGARAVLEATGARPGPVHLNLPFREPLVGKPGHLPPGRESGAPWHRRLAGLERETPFDVPTARGIIVAGHVPGGVVNPETVLNLAAHLGWPLLADPRTGCRIPHAQSVAAFDSLLRIPEFVAAAQPEFVIRIGQPPASKVLAQWLAGLPCPQVVIDPTGSWPDPDRTASLLIHQLPTGLRDRAHQSAPPSWLALWTDADEQAQHAIDRALAVEPMCEPALARALLASLPHDSHLVVSSSMPVRDIEWFGSRRSGVTMHSNRGANGIDGVVATATGVALATSRPTAVYLGDIALLHDSSSLVGLGGRDLDLRIVVTDNDGGGIFSFLPQATALESDRFERLFGTPHGTDISALAGAHHLRFTSPSTVDEFVAAVTSPGPSLISVPTDRAENVHAHERINTAVALAVAEGLRASRSR